MARLSSRLEQLEKSNAPADICPVLLICPNDDKAEALAGWLARHGPCDAEPFYIRLVGPLGGT